MKRPQLVNFMAIQTDSYLAIRASLTLKENTLGPTEKLFKARFPLQNVKLLRSNEFSIMIIGQDKDKKEVYRNIFDSDNFGSFNFKIPLKDERATIKNISIYETKTSPGLEIMLGTFFPKRLLGENKLIICDFDKTLVDTKYSTPKEVYRSLTSSLDKFPTVLSSVSLLRDYISKGFDPFILSASPHFYEDAMRDWLYQNGIYTAEIFLKDYRRIFSIFDNELTPKDLKVQGLYKLNHLLDILLMTGIPKSLVLMGDNFESDPIIYLTLASILDNKLEARVIWNQVREQESFKLNRKQNTQFLNKIYQLQSFVKKSPPIEDFKIFIRKKYESDKLNLPKNFKGDSSLIELYEGIHQQASLLESS